MYPETGEHFPTKIHALKGSLAYYVYNSRWAGGQENAFFSSMKMFAKNHFNGFRELYDDLSKL